MVCISKNLGMTTGFRQGLHSLSLPDMATGRWVKAYH